MIARFPPPPCTIVICSKAAIMRVVAEQRFDGIISIIDPGRHKVWFPHHVKSMRQKLAKHCNHILQLQFWDTDDENEVSGPREHHIAAIREFAKDMHGKKIAIHCMFGIARSPAAAIIVLRALGFPPADAIAYVKQVQPLARPNALMLRLDDLSPQQTILQDEQIFGNARECTATKESDTT